ncbi:MAG: hypothetical protein AAGK93_02245 [Pseudomonadota bacterium]
MWKFIKWGLIGWLVLSVLTLPFYWPFLRMLWVFMPMVEAPKYDPPETAIEARLQDVDYLSTLIKYDRSFSDDAEQVFSERLDAISDAAETMTDAEFYLALSESVALADNGHTSVNGRPRYTAFNTIGARFYNFRDGTFIVRAATEHAETLGHRVVSIEGIPIDTLLTDLAKFKGGNEVWRNLYNTFLIESPELLAAAGVIDAADALEMTLEAPSGEQRQVTFNALSALGSDQPGRAAWHSLVPKDGNAVHESWAHVLDAEAVPLPTYLTNTSEPLSYALEGNGLYIRALPGFAAGEETIQNAYKAILAEHPEGSLDYLVVDFRLHDGGDYTKSMRFSKAAPKRVKEDGDIYIITGPNTFSAAIVTVAMLKYNSGARGIIIGEQMGDREQFWAERGTDFRLPNSGYYINYATGYHDWETGCKGEPFCYTMNEMYEVPAGSLSPEVVLETAFSDYLAGEDVVMNWVKAQR